MANRPLSRVPFPCVIYTLNTPVGMHMRISEERAARMDAIVSAIRDNRLDVDRSFKEEFELQ